MILLIFVNTALTLTYCECQNVRIIYTKIIQVVKSVTENKYEHI